MILVNVIRKFINIIPMQKSITQNDELAVTYRFKIKREYEDLDLGDLGWEWTLAWKNSLDVASTIFLSSTVTEDEVLLDWTPNWPETSSDGLFEFQIRAKKVDDLSGKIRIWNTQIARLDFNTSIGLGKVDRGILEDYLNKFMQLCSEASIEAEVRRALSKELELSEKIDNVEERIQNQLEIISNAISNISNDLDNFDKKIISNYEIISEDSGEVTNEDSLDLAIAKLQYQIKHVRIEDIVPVEKGGTGVSSFEQGVLYSNGGTTSFKSTFGVNGEILTIKKGIPTFRKISTEDLSDEANILKFKVLEETDIDLSTFME